MRSPSYRGLKYYTHHDRVHHLSICLYRTSPDCSLPNCTRPSCGLRRSNIEGYRGRGGSATTIDGMGWGRLYIEDCSGFDDSVLRLPLSRFHEEHDGDMRFLYVRCLERRGNIYFSFETLQKVVTFVKEQEHITFTTIIGYNVPCMTEEQKTWFSSNVPHFRWKS
jgi:hypothetical protein